MIRIPKSRILFSSIAFCWLVFFPCLIWAKTTQGRFSQEAIAGNNEGVALLGKFDFESATKHFEKLSKSFPDIWQFRFNQAVSILNRQKEGDEQKALDILNSLSPKSRAPEIDYCKGLLILRAGQPEKALAYFEPLSKAMPQDPDIHYFMASSLMQLSRFQDALAHFNRVLELDPYSQSAIYGQMMAFRQLRQLEEAKASVKAFTKIKKNPRARLTEFKYTRMGKLSEAIVIGNEKAKRENPPEGPIFEAFKPLFTQEPPVAVSNMTCCDLNADGNLNFLMVSSTGIWVLTSSNEGKLSVSTKFPFSGIKNVNAAAWGDIDDNGFPDLYLFKNGANQLWLQTQKGQWEDHTEASQTGNGTYKSVDGAIVDSDHDGDLDIWIINEDGPNELLNNNRNGSFKPLAEELKITGNSGPSRSICLGDLDSDGDTDFIYLNAKPPHQVFINDLLWSYSTDPIWQPLEKSDIKMLAISDLNSDGRQDMISIDHNNSVTLWLREDKGLVQHKLKVPAFKAPISHFFIEDVDGDLIKDLVFGDKYSTIVGSLNGTEFKTSQTIPHDDLTTYLMTSTLKGPELLGWQPGNGLFRASNGTGRWKFCLLTLKGVEDRANSFRSNASGIGARLDIRIGSEWNVISNLKSSSQQGQSLQPLVVGTNGTPQIDFVRIEWSDGVLQTEMKLPSKTRRTIVETQRQLSSCPVIFGWDGSSYQFISDILGVGGMGYSTGKGTYAPSRPWEYFMIPKGLLKPINGNLSLILGEPMEEAAYIDHTSLVAYDLPPNWQMTLDERMGILGPDVTGAPVFFHHFTEFSHVQNDRGENVTELVKEADLKPADPGPLDPRFIGMLADQHVLDLTLDNPLGSIAGRPVLVSDGWVEYPYSQTNFAAWQAGAGYQAPSLYYKDRDGKWQLAYEQFGYPAGMPRQMSVPLDAIPSWARELRLVTNQEIYWDRIFVAYADENPQIRKTECPLKESQLQFVGFPERKPLPFRLPDYDYSHRNPLWDAKVQDGYYTDFGSVTPLLTKSDGALVILGPGEGVTMNFKAPDPAPEGWTRVFVLETRGWCKDMDRFTQLGQTLEPIPGEDLRKQSGQKLHNQYQNRFRGGIR